MRLQVLIVWLSSTAVLVMWLWYNTLGKQLFDYVLVLTSCFVLGGWWSVTWNKASLHNVLIGPPTLIKLGCNRLSCKEKGTRKREREILFSKWNMFEFCSFGSVNNSLTLKPPFNRSGKGRRKMEENNSTLLTKVNHLWPPRTHPELVCLTTELAERKLI